ncbi:MAG: hypothetical protein SX243_24395 [Acidobacteriota bacterium]|nr:hypothetical protein [Acidobacteriota bacterium]
MLIRMRKAMKRRARGYEKHTPGAFSEFQLRLFFAGILLLGMLVGMALAAFE